MFTQPTPHITSIQLRTIFRPDICDKMLLDFVDYLGEISMQASLPSEKILDREFLGIRAKLIDMAASLDRIQRADGTIPSDPRIEKITLALEILTGRSPDRAENVELLFSLPYDENWRNA
jgi:hypothetical protein